MTSKIGRRMVGTRPPNLTPETRRTISLIGVSIGLGSRVRTCSDDGVRRTPDRRKGRRLFDGKADHTEMSDPFVTKPGAWLARRYKPVCAAALAGQPAHWRAGMNAPTLHGLEQRVISWPLMAGVTRSGSCRGAWQRGRYRERVLLPDGCSVLLRPVTIAMQPCCRASLPSCRLAHGCCASTAPSTACPTRQRAG